MIRIVRHSLLRINAFSSLEKLKQQKENQIKEKLSNSLATSEVFVKDIGGGCGTMYDIKIESKLFEGKTRVQQHQMVQNVISDELKTIHGLNLKTLLPKNSENKTN